MLALVTFIMIYHFYLQRHLSDVQDIISQQSNEFMKLFGFGKPTADFAEQTINTQPLEPSCKIPKDVVQLE